MMMEVLPLTPPRMARCGCDCAGEKKKGEEINEKHFGGLEVRCFE